MSVLPCDYWEYYNPDYAWDDDNSATDAIASRELSEHEFLSKGCSAPETEKLLESGYIAFFELVVDRFYGGLLWSTDNRTRFAPKYFAREFPAGSRQVDVYRARSIGDLRACGERWRSSLTGRLLLRGLNR